MGIVITFIMLLALLLIAPLAVDREWRLLDNRGNERIASTIVLSGGLWNVFWYGMQHLREFWGIAAIGSGVAMIAAAIVLLSGKPQRHLLQFLSLALFGFFLLYLVTLVQLNVGMPIIR